MLGNTQLVAYGIQTEKSDLRVHVSVVARRIYVFKTSDGVRALSSTDCVKQVRTGNFITANGKPVPLNSIQGCATIEIPSDIFALAKFLEDDTTSGKGNKAVFVVKEMLKRGLIPITATPEEITDRDLQIQGTDIIITARARIQVKCDWRAGHREFGGTGNLFLQISECNPHKMH